MSNRPTRFRIVAVMACALALAVAATATEPKAPKADAPQATAQAAPRVVIVRDAQTGMLRPATVQEVQTMAAQIDQLLNRSTVGLKTVTAPNGAKSMDLQGRYMHGTFARVGADGRVEQICTDDAEGAKEFLGLTPAKPAPAVAKTEGR
jgi:hypothetical protein